METNRLSAGFDIGAGNIKVVIMQGDRLLAGVCRPCGHDTRTALVTTFKEALQAGQIELNQIGFAGATGMGRESVPFATFYATESTCSARGAIWHWPAARCVIDIGAEGSRVFTMNAEGRILQHVRNDNCAAGAGAFLESMAVVLEIELPDINRYAAEALRQIPLNSTCTIFAESEVISLLNEGSDRSQAAWAVCDAIATRTAALAAGMDVTNTLFIGGVARNTFLAELLGSRLGVKLVIPEQPDLITAAGAALLAVRGTSGTIPPEVLCFQPNSAGERS